MSTEFFQITTRTSQKIAPFCSVLLAVGTFLSAGLLYAETTLRLTPESGWKSCNNGVFEQSKAIPGQMYSIIKIDADIEAGKYYVLSWKARCASNDGILKMSLLPKWADKYQCSENEYFLSGEWLEYRSYFYTGQSKGDVTFQLQMFFAAGKAAEVKDLKIAQLTDLTSNMLPEGGFSGSAKYPALWCADGYKSGLAYLLTSAFDAGSISGASMKYQPGIYGNPGAINQIKTVAMPVRPGRKYRFECWVKSSREVPLRLIITNWFNPHRENGHWFKISQAAADTQWRKIEFDTVITEDLLKYPDFQARAVRIGLGTAEKDVTIDIAGCSFQEVR